MTDSVIHLEVEMTGERREDTKRRAQAIEYALRIAQRDTAVAIRMALGRAYSDLHMGVERGFVISQLRDLISNPALHAAALGWQSRLRDTVAARTRGDKCGDYIGQVQLELLNELLIPMEDPPDAA